MRAFEEDRQPCIEVLGFVGASGPALRRARRWREFRRALAAPFIGAWDFFALLLPGRGR